MLLIPTDVVVLAAEAVATAPPQYVLYTTLIIASFSFLGTAVTAWATVHGKRESKDTNEKVSAVQTQITTNHGLNIGQHVEATHSTAEDLRSLVVIVSQMITDLSYIQAAGQEEVLEQVHEAWRYPDQVAARPKAAPGKYSRTVCHIPNCDGGCGMVHNAPPNDPRKPWFPGRSV